MKNYFYLVIVSFLIFNNCKKIEKESLKNISKTQHFNSVVVTDNKKILSKIINSFEKSKNIAIMEETTIDGIVSGNNEIKFVNFNYRLPCLDEETFEDFIFTNIHSTKIKNDFYTKKSIIILTEEQIKEALKDFILVGWEVFYKTYGEETQGLLSFSKIGYNKERNKAIIYYSNQRNNTIASGYILVLNKIKNEWEVCSSSKIWIS